jgi:hypothetical protein
MQTVQKMKCNICNDVLKFKNGVALFDLDHVVPYCISFDDNITNLQCICLDCHRYKTTTEKNKIKRLRELQHKFSLRNNKKIVQKYTVCYHCEKVISKYFIKRHKC